MKAEFYRTITLTYNNKEDYHQGCQIQTKYIKIYILYDNASYFKVAILDVLYVKS